jgi:hypothetical protein
LSWRTTGNRPEPGYRWYQELQTVHAGPTGAFGGLMTLPVSPRAFASSTVSVIVSDGHTGQTLARAMSAISLPAPPPSPAPAPPSPVQGHDKKPKPDYGKHHGDEGD